MSTSFPDRPATERAAWWLTAAATIAAGAVWAFATPLFTGPDEVSQARRAAAVARGELTGRQERPGPPLLLTVDVPPLYGEPAEENWLCHLGPLVAGAPQEPMALPSPPCPDLRAPRAEPISGLVAAETVQYRGQPFFYGLAGLPTLVADGVVGAYGMRMVVVVLTAALVASAATTLVGSDRRDLAAVGLVACLTPGVLYLSASTNPSAVEIAAAISAWAAVGALATRRSGAGPDAGSGVVAGAGGDVGASEDVDAETGRLVTRLGVALVVLTLCRGLGPGFAVAVVGGGGLIAGWGRTRELLGRTDVRWWSAAVAAALAASLAWLAHIGSAFPLPERVGSGAAQAVGWLPWYLRQSVGVFGTNDSALAPVAAAAWCVVALGVFATGSVGLWRQGTPTAGRHAAVAALALGGGVVLNVTAEGLSIPPIGFFWQGRYALPLLLGGIVLSVAGRGAGSSAGVTSGPTGSGASDLGSADHGSSHPAAPSPSPAAAMAAWIALAVLVAVHGHGLWVVTAHHGSPTATLRVMALLSYAAALATMAIVLVRPHEGERA